MKIQSLQLKNFKRFTDLAIQDIPVNAKLVLLIGTNGSGKSSIFDAFEHLSTLAKASVFYQPTFEVTEPIKYYSKDESLDYKISILDEKGREHTKTKAHANISLTQESFYGRSSFRQVPV